MIENIHETRLAQAHPLLAKLSERGHFRFVGGGRSVIEELEWPDPPMWCRLELAKGGWAKPNPDVIFSAAEYQFAQCAGTSIGDAVAGVCRGLTEQRESVGFFDGHQPLFGNWTGPNISVRNLVNSPTGIVGGIDSSVWSFWRSMNLRRGDVSLVDAMNVVYEGLSGPGCHPDFIIMNRDDYREFGESSTFEGAAVMCDDLVKPAVINGVITPAPMLFLNTGYLWFRTHSGRNLAEIDADRFAAAADDHLPKNLWAWAGALTMSCAYVHGSLSKA
jgi:hypothetical protein